MIDLFGLGKHKDPEESAPEADSPEPAAPRGSQKLWAFLLVLDAVFVIVFAGALAAKIYQYWSAPAAPLVTASRRRPVKEPPKAAEATAASTAATTAAAAPAAAAPPPKAPEPPPAPAPKPVAAVNTSPDAPRPPKPSMLVDAPRHRGIPPPADAAGKTAAAPASAPEPKAAPAPAAPGGKVKALPAEFKIHAPKAKSVNLVGAFIVRGGRKEMARQEDGNWTITLYLNPGQYRYFFSVDKKKTLDPENPNTEKGASVMSVP